MFEKEAFIEACLQTLREGSPPRAVREVVRRAIARPAELDRVMGPPTTAGIQTLYRSPELTILQLVWAPAMVLYPHNHQTWAVIGLYGGQEDNTFYRRRPEGVGLQRVNGRSLQEEDTIILGEHTIHSVSNPRRMFTGAIHVYGGDFFSLPRSEWASEDAPERPYSVERALQVFADANERARELLAREAGVANPGVVRPALSGGDPT